MPGNLSTALSGLPTLREVAQRRDALLALQPTAADLRPALPHTPPHSPHSTLELAAPALHGLAGLVVHALAPHIEAHPAAILLQFLAAFGNLVGRGPHCMVNATRHSLNLFVVLAGDSGKARKGASWAQLTSLFAKVDQPWLDTRVTTARLTASGLLRGPRNPVPLADQPQDHRMLVVSEEFASVLRSFHHGNNNLSSLLRHIWDHGRLLPPNLRQDLPGVEAHVSLIAHITPQDLAHSLHPAEIKNGFGNRCLWTLVRRTRCLPDGGSVDPLELSFIAGELRRALSWATAGPEILFKRDEAARELWHQRYSDLSQVHPALRGAATGRAEAQVLRLSAIYAALDASVVITRPHLEAALAVWDYCEASAGALFGKSTGDPIGDRMREAIEAAPLGLSQYQIRRLFHGHIDSARIESALNDLMRIGAIACHSQPTGGRPATLWTANANQRKAEEQNQKR